jgi:hypothetical protein
MPKPTGRRTEGMEQLPGHPLATNRSSVRWYAAARAALGQNRPLTTAATPPFNRRSTAEHSAGELVGCPKWRRRRHGGGRGSR